MWNLGTFIQGVQPSLADLMSLKITPRWRSHWPGRATAWPCQGLYRLWCLGGCGRGPGIWTNSSDSDSGKRRLCKVDQSGSFWAALTAIDWGMPVLRRYLQVACQCVRRSRTMLTGLSPVFKKFWCLVEIVVRVMACGGSWQIRKRFQAL